VSVTPIDDQDLLALAELIDRYYDRPMDLADATLVHLASRLRVETIFTVDLDDFETYRIDGKRKFQIVPGR
jgi:predicted nucleic acid-binding protein